MPYGALRVQQGKIEIVGPSAIVLGVPREHAVDDISAPIYCLYGTDQEIDNSLTVMEHDVVLEGKNWFGQDPVAAAIGDPRLNQLSAQRRPGKSLRPIDVLLWMGYRELEKATGPTSTINPKTTFFYEGVGWEDPDGWAQLAERAPGWDAYKDRHYYEVSDMMAYEGNPFG